MIQNASGHSKGHANPRKIPCFKTHHLNCAPVWTCSKNVLKHWLIHGSTELLAILSMAKMEHYFFLVREKFPPQWSPKYQPNVRHLEAEPELERPQMLPRQTALLRHAWQDTCDQLTNPDTQTTATSFLPDVVGWMDQKTTDPPVPLQVCWLIFVSSH